MTFLRLGTLEIVAVAGMLAGCGAGLEESDLNDSEFELESAQNAVTAPLGYGQINVYAASTTFQGQHFKGTIATARFAKGPKGNLSTCTRTAANGCELVTCVANKSQDPVMKNRVGTGTVELNVNAYQLFVGQAADKTYGLGTNRNTVFTGGETIRVTSPGGVIPAISDTVVAPSQIKITAPTLTDDPFGKYLPIPKKTPLDVIWVPGTTGEVKIKLHSHATKNKKNYSLECSAPNASGKFTIVPAALAKLPSSNGAITAFATNTKKLSVGNYDVAVTAETDTYTPTGDGFWQMVQIK